MTMCEFIDNLAYTGFNYDRGLLKTLYTKIKNQAFKSNEPPLSEKHRPRMSNTILANQFVRQITDQVDCEFFWSLLKIQKRYRKEESELLERKIWKGEKNFVKRCKI
jgi:hypothetical protein